MKILLSKYRWFNKDNVWVTGFIMEKDQILQNNDLASFFSVADSFLKLESILKSANGQFSVIIKSTGEIWTASDRLRNYPVFYTKFNGEFYISDDSYRLAGVHPVSEFNSVAKTCFQAAGFVINNQTLIKNVYQVEAGGFAVLGDLIRSGYYYNSTQEKIIQKDFNDFSEELGSLIREVFGSYFRSLKNRFIAIPLSGGFDSRLIAAMCSEYHPENVICYTYGAKNNPEVSPAREVAKRLGFKWINVVYDEQLINGFLDDNIFKEYYPFASQLSGMFFLQEYFAVKFIKEKKLIPDDTVFIPGFTGDVLAGSHLSPGMNIYSTRERIAELIFREYFRLIKLSATDKSAITDLICDRIEGGRLPVWKVVESFDMKERQAKFVVNSASVFKYFGYDYILPFWDNRLIDYFSVVPFHFKLNKKLYDHVLKEMIFKARDLNFTNEINPTGGQKRLQQVKEKIKLLLPYKVRNLFIEKSSPIFYDKITQLMIDDFGDSPLVEPRQMNYYNSYISQWYLLKTKEYFKI